MNIQMFELIKSTRFHKWLTDTESSSTHLPPSLYCGPVLFWVRSLKISGVRGNLHLPRKLSQSHLWLQSQLNRGGKGQIETESAGQSIYCSKSKHEHTEFNEASFASPDSLFIPIVSVHDVRGARLAGSLQLRKGSNAVVVYFPLLKNPFHNQEKPWTKIRKKKYIDRGVYIPSPGHLHNDTRLMYICSLKHVAVSSLNRLGCCVLAQNTLSKSETTVL